MSNTLNRLQPWGALLMRLALALLMAVHGYQKVVPHGALNHFSHYVASLGLPYWLGSVSAFTEFIGGILLIFGLFTRLAATLISFDLLVALFLVGIHQGFNSYSNLLALTAISLMLVFYGAGAAALDRKIGFA